MKKYLKLLMVAIFASMSFAFVSCGDDKDDEPDNNGVTGSTSSFVGTWEMTTSGVLGEGDGDNYIKIANDHTFILINHYSYGVEVSYGTWTSTIDTFTVDYEIFHGTTPIVPSVTYKIESTTSNSFILSLGIQKFTFTKVSDSVMDKYQDDIDDVM